MKNQQARNRKLINSWLKEQGRNAIAVKGYCEFASQLSRETAPRHSWRHFDDRKEAEKFINDFALSIGIKA